MKIKCTHWQDCGLTNGGCCKIKEFNKPSYGICLKVCDRYDGPYEEPRIERQSVGLGDTVEKILKTLGIKRLITKFFKTCGCEKRRKWLNKLFPYGKEV